MKDYLETENLRNKEHADLYVQLIQRAFGREAQVMIGHHLSFEFEGKLETENEIPSADTLLFCHEAMGRIFGELFEDVMIDLALAPTEKREEVVKKYLRVIDGT